MQEALEGLEALFVPLLQWLRLVIEAAAAFWVVVGFGYAFVALIAAHVRRQVASFKGIRLMFSRYLSLALEFQLAADILSTAIAPTFDDLAKLAITAVVRTGLNYFLSKEMREYVVDHEREARVAAAPDASFHAGASRTVAMP